MPISTNAWTDRELLKGKCLDAKVLKMRVRMPSLHYASTWKQLINDRDNFKNHLRD